MPQFNRYEDDGLMLMVKYTCQRCGRTQLEKLEDMDKDPESYGHLHNLMRPKGWEKIHLHGPLLCPECIRAYVAFLKNEKEAKI